MITSLTEHQTQASFFTEVAHYRYRNRADFMPALFYAVLNGAWIAGDGRRKSALLEKYRSEGWRPGIADVMYDQPRGRFNKLVFEFKREDKRNKKEKGILTGGLSPEQIEYLTSIKPYAFVRVVYTVEEAVAEFDHYMSLPVFGSEEVWTVQDILNGVEK